MVTQFERKACSEPQKATETPTDWVPLSGFKLFIVGVGAKRSLVVRAVQKGLNVSAAAANVVVDDCPGRIRQPIPARAAISEVSTRSCGCLQDLREVGVDVGNLIRGGGITTPDYTFSKDEALRFAQDLRAAGADVIVIDPAW